MIAFYNKLESTDSNTYGGHKRPCMDDLSSETGNNLPAHVAWCRYVRSDDRPTRIQLCDSDTKGAFPVYRYSQDKEIERLRAVLQEQAKWLRERGAQLDEYVTTQHDYYKRAEFLERALKGEK